jgi:hypothetical protein
VFKQKHDTKNNINPRECPKENIPASLLSSCKPTTEKYLQAVSISQAWQFNNKAALKTAHGKEELS